MPFRFYGTLPVKKLLFLALLALPLTTEAGHGPRAVIVQRQLVAVGQPQRVIVQRQLVAVQPFVVVQRRAQRRPQPGPIRRVLKRIF